MAIKSGTTSMNASRLARIARRLNDVMHGDFRLVSPPRTESLPQLTMRRPTLADLPQIQTPQGVVMRSMKPEDEAAWDRVVGAAFGWAEPLGKFNEIMRSDPAFRPERVLMAFIGGVAVATAAAWHRPVEYGERTGYLHFVAVSPGKTCRGLGTMVSLAALHTMKAERRDSAVLLTDDFRLPAVFIYLRLGFEPWVTHESHRRRWREVFDQLQAPALHGQYEPQLAAPLHLLPSAH